MGTSDREALNPHWVFCRRPFSTHSSKAYSESQNHRTTAANVIHPAIAHPEKGSSSTEALTHYGA
jgi:hypothetical protein